MIGNATNISNLSAVLYVNNIFLNLKIPMIVKEITIASRKKYLVNDLNNT